MVTYYLANALIITLFVVIGIGFIGLIARLIGKLCLRVKIKQQDREFEHKMLENRLDYFGTELRAMFDNFVKIEERMKKLEEKKNEKKTSTTKRSK